MQRSDWRRAFRSHTQFCLVFHHIFCLNWREHFVFLGEWKSAFSAGAVVRLPVFVVLLSDHHKYIRMLLLFFLIVQDQLKYVRGVCPPPALLLQSSSRVSLSLSTGVCVCWNTWVLVWWTFYSFLLRKINHLENILSVKPWMFPLKKKTPKQ